MPSEVCYINPTLLYTLRFHSVLRIRFDHTLTRPEL